MNTNKHPHLDEALKRDIERIRAKVSEMAALSEIAIRASVRAVRERSRKIAYSIILRDQYIDEMETELDRLCLEFFARHQPVARDLRFVFSTVHINRELERIGDYAESVARQVVAICSLAPVPSLEKFVELGDLAAHMLRDAVHAFVQQDEGLAARTMPVEERANTLRNAINAELKELMQANRIHPDSLTPLMTIARRLERVTDQAKNICEEVLYMCTGEFAKHKSADGFRILFVDEHNGVRSQLAEAIGQALRLEHFVFCSAGITPQPLDPRLSDFLAAKGLRAAPATAKSVEQVPGWEHFQIVVAFGASVREALPPHPGKTVNFTWAVPDPLAPASPAGVPAALEECHRVLVAQIKDLVDAILLEP